MQLFTKIDIPKADFEIESGQKILLLGSCFADEIGLKLQHGGFDALVNPFGTLYNPASIAASLLRSISEREYTSVSPELIFDASQNVWHSWMHHSKFSSSSKEELIEQMNATTMQVSNFLREADVLIITLGTAIIYRMKDTGMLVANCHKQLDSLFDRQRLSSYDIADQWQMLLQLLHSINPKLNIVFTVSPIRHKRDGMHINQISKGILLQAVDELVNNESPDAEPLNGESANAKSVNSKSVTGKCTYFPAYEIMLDELRDYRFYADDMIHPSPLAVEYIWQRFQDTYFSNKTKDTVAKATKSFARSQHRQIVSKSSIFLL